MSRRVFDLDDGSGSGSGGGGSGGGGGGGGGSSDHHPDSKHSIHSEPDRRIRPLLSLPPPPAPSSEPPLRKVDTPPFPFSYPAWVEHVYDWSHAVIILCAAVFDLCVTKMYIRDASLMFTTVHVVLLAMAYVRLCVAVRDQHGASV